MLWILFATLPSVAVVISDSTSVLSIDFVFFKTSKLRIIDVSSIRHSCAMLCLIYNVHGKVELTSKCTLFMTRCLFPGALCKLWRPCWGTWCVFVYLESFMTVLEARFEFAKMWESCHWKVEDDSVKLFLSCLWQYKINSLGCLLVSFIVFIQVMDLKKCPGKFTWRKKYY